MNFRIKLILWAIITSLLSSCEFGIFNKDYPDRAIFQVSIDNQPLYESSDNSSLSFDIDDKQFSGKILKVSAIHKKNDRVIDKGGFTYASKTIKMNIEDQNTISVNLSSIDALGSHEIKCKSTISKAFDKSFIINLTSLIENFEIEYSLKEAQEGQDYKDAKSGKINIKEYKGEYINMVSGGEYLLHMTPVSSQKMPKISITSSDENTIKLSRHDSTNYILSINEMKQNTKFALHISIENSDIENTIFVNTLNIKDIKIDENYEKSDDELIYLNKNDGARDFNIHYKTQQLESKILYACLLEQQDDSKKDKSVESWQKKDAISLSNNFMELHFDGREGKLNINPINDTTILTESGRKNIFFYLYTFDTLGNFVKRIRICIGGMCENIYINPETINVKTLKSGTITASLSPVENEDIIWYFSKYKGVKDFPPPPLTRNEIRNIINSLNPKIERTNIDIAGTLYDSDEYFFANTTSGDLSFYYTTLSQASSLYIVAKCLNSNCYKSAVFLISAESEIILKSSVNVIDKKVPGCNFTDIESFESSLEVKNFPQGQYYPYTAQGAEDELSRTFYIPHNKTSYINVITNKAGEKLSLQTSKSAISLFESELVPLDLPCEYCIELTPIWYSTTKRHILDENIPPASENIKQGMDGWGNLFYQYLGIGIISLKSEKAEIKIKVVVYDGT